MKVKCVIKEKGALIYGKIYDVLSIEMGLYRVIDESGEDYLYSPTAFEIVEEEDGIKGR